MKNFDLNSKPTDLSSFCGDEYSNFLFLGFGKPTLDNFKRAQILSNKINKPVGLGSFGQPVINGNRFTVFPQKGHSSTNLESKPNLVGFIAGQISPILKNAPQGMSSERLDVLFKLDDINLLNKMSVDELATIKDVILYETNKYSGNESKNDVEQDMKKVLVKYGLDQN